MFKIMAVSPKGITNTGLSSPTPQVSLDSRVREIINRNMVDPTPHTFDEAQTQIYTLMHRDSYPRFINSAIYKRLAQLNNNGSSGSSRKESAT